MDKQNRHNYFKLPGSYIGFLIGLLPISTILLNVIGISNELYKIKLLGIPMFLNPLFYWEWSSCHEAGCGIISMITTPFVLFIIGGLINSWYKRRKSKIEGKAYNT